MINRPGGCAELRAALAVFPARVPSFPLGSPVPPGASLLRFGSPATLWGSVTAANLPALTAAHMRLRLQKRRWQAPPDFRHA